MKKKKKINNKEESTEKEVEEKFKEKGKPNEQML